MTTTCNENTKVISSISTGISPFRQKGLLISFEGIDRCGKSTQASSLAWNLSQMSWDRLSCGFDAPHLRSFPDRTTTIGKILDSYLKGELKSLDSHALYMLFCANRWEHKDNIEGSLKRGRSVILDRYVHSGTVYGLANNLPKIWCQGQEIGLPMPDIVVFIDLDPKIAAQRQNHGPEFYDKLEFQEKLNELYLEQSDSGFDRLYGSKWMIVDGSRPKDQITKDIRERFELIDKFRKKGLSLDILLPNHYPLWRPPNFDGEIMPQWSVPIHSKMVKCCKCEEHCLNQNGYNWNYEEEKFYCDPCLEEWQLTPEFRLYDASF